MTDTTSAKLLPCPFCDHEVNSGDNDVLHPAGIYWVESEHIGRTYVGRNHMLFIDRANECWSVNCAESGGGCGANVIGDSKDEAIGKWNTRAPQAQQSDHVPMPQNEDQAFAMQTVGYAWLRDNAPHRLKAQQADISDIAMAIHYPDCWDTMAYPTLLSAINEIGCNPDCCTKIEPQQPDHVEGSRAMVGQSAEPVAWLYKIRGGHSFQTVEFVSTAGDDQCWRSREDGDWELLSVAPLYTAEAIAAARAAGRREAFAECVEVCELVAASNKTSNGFSIATSAVHDAIKVRIDEVVNDCQLQN